MNDQVLMGQQTFALTRFIQQYPFCETVGAVYRHLRECYEAGDVELHLIDSRVQVDVIEALRALAQRYPHRYARLAALADQLEAQVSVPSRTDLFA